MRIPSARLGMPPQQPSRTMARVEEVPKMTRPGSNSTFSGARTALLVLALILMTAPTAIAQTPQAELVLSIPSLREVAGFASELGRPRDINGDNYPDILADAGQDDGNGRDAGAAYLFYGGPDADQHPELVLLGERPYEYFGWQSLDLIGDYNDDGFEDFAIGARYHNGPDGNLLNDCGKVYIYLGDEVLPTTPAFTVTGEKLLGNMGFEVSGIGDFNNDNYDDLAVGERRGGAGDRGRVHLFWGGPDADDVADLVLEGEQNTSWFGSRIIGLEDFNGDGCADMAVGAPRFAGEGPEAGRVYIFFGGSSPDTTADLILDAQSAGESFGWSLAAGGDINGDGLTDLLVGSTYRILDTGATRDSLGKVYAFLGSADPSDSPAMVYYGTERGDYFGCSISSAGDLNADGYGDIIVGAQWHNNRDGRAYVYLGGEALDPAPAVEIDPLAPGDHLGTEVGYIWGIGGEPGPQVIVAAAGADPNFTGRVAVYRITDLLPSPTIRGRTLCGGAPLGGITVDLSDAEGTLIASRISDVGDGTYEFGDLEAGDYIMDVVTPLGYEPAAGYPVEVPVALASGDVAEIDFAFDALQQTADARSPGYWKHQYRAHLSGRGHAHESEAALTGYHDLLFTRFFGRADPYAIQIPSVTYSAGPAALSFEDALETLSSGRGTMHERASRQFLALLLNVASGKVGQYHIATESGSTVSQIITYVADLLEDGDPANDELAKDLVEDINHNRLISSDPVPPSVPNIAYGRPLAAGDHLALSGPHPNPARGFTRISFRSPQRGARASLRIYDAGGRLVRELFDGVVDAPETHLQWRCTDQRDRRVFGGVYYCRLEIGDQIETRPIVVK
ncbi:MAG: hypothetical protein GF330_07290 [Candidatus Eisenbacteria bacterium]|nr:hypothetical protein [Candidatus Eisenbacteria bacterium]